MKIQYQLSNQIEAAPHMDQPPTKNDLYKQNHIAEYFKQGCKESLICMYPRERIDELELSPMKSIVYLNSVDTRRANSKIHTKMQFHH